MAFETLIRAEELAELIERRTAGHGIVVIDCRFALNDPSAGGSAYAEGHIPSAVYAHLDEDLSSPITETSGRHPLPKPEEFAAKLARWGVDDATQVVAYDESGGAFAARLWWLCRWVGLRHVAVLDGGLAAWKDLGGELTTEVASVLTKDWRATADDASWLTSQALGEHLDREAVVLIDARGAERFAGRVEPIDPVAGHVPGAINLPFQENLRENGMFQNRESLRQRFLDALPNGDSDPVVHMCGSGVTACHNVLAMEVAGIPSGQLYAGSWSEWIRDPSRPVATGSNS